MLRILTSALTIFVLVVTFLTPVKLLAAKEDVLVQERIKMIKYVADNMLYAVNAYRWQLAIHRYNGLPIDEVEYALVRDLGQELTRKSGQLMQSMKFVSDTEFTSKDANPDRLAINDLSGTIYWNNHKLARMREFTVFDTFKILFHEATHKINVITESRDSDKGGLRLKSVADVMYSDFFGGYEEYPVSKALKDKFASQFVDFVRSRTMSATDLNGKMTVYYLNLLLNGDRNSQKLVFFKEPVHEVIERSQLAWIVTEGRFSKLSASLESFLEKLIGRAPKVTKSTLRSEKPEVANISSDRTPIVPVVEIQSISFNRIGEIVINYNFQNVLGTPNSWRSSMSSHDINYEEPIVLSDKPQRRIAVLNLGSTVGDKINYPHARVDVNVKETWIEGNFSKVAIVSQNRKTFFTVEIENVPAEMTQAVLICKDQDGRKFSFYSRYFFYKQGRQKRFVQFEINHSEPLSVVEILLPKYKASPSSNEYIEYSLRSTDPIAITGVSESKIIPPFATPGHVKLAQLENGKIELVVARYWSSSAEKDIRQLQELSPGLFEIVESVILEVTIGNSQKYLVNRSDFAVEWEEPVVQRLLIPNQKIRKYLKATHYDQLVLELPLEIFSSEKRTDRKNLALTGIWVRLKNGHTEKLTIENSDRFRFEIKKFPQPISNKIFNCEYLF